MLEDERKHQRKLQEQRLIRLDLDNFNKLKLQQRHHEVQTALEMDMKILSEFLRLDRLEKETKQRRREELRREMQMYRQHLQQQKDIEKQREKEIENWYSAEQERLWKVRGEKWRKEQAARDRLMKEVMTGRQEQLQHALERNRQAQEQVRIEKIQIEKQIEESKQIESKAHEKHYQSMREYSRVLTEQIDAAEKRKLEEKRRVELEDAAQKVNQESLFFVYCPAVLVLTIL